MLFSFSGFLSTKVAAPSQVLAVLSHSWYVRFEFLRIWSRIKVTLFEAVARVGEKAEAIVAGQ